MLPRPIIAIFIFILYLLLKVISGNFYLPSFIKYFDISSILHFFTIVQTSTILFCDLFIRFDKHFY